MFRLLWYHVAGISEPPEVEPEVLRVGGRGKGKDHPKQRYNSAQAIQ